MLAAITALIGKDLRLLARDRGALFLTFAWPLLLAIFFGALGPGFGAQTGGGSAMTVLLDELEANPRVTLELASPAAVQHSLPGGGATPCPGGTFTRWVSALSFVLS
jgi:ABC-2 type transport system permease protein